MSQNGQSGLPSGPNHVAHDSALSVGSTSTKAEDTAKIRDLEDENTNLAEKANAACMYINVIQFTPLNTKGMLIY